MPPYLEDIRQRFMALDCNWGDPPPTTSLLGSLIRSPNAVSDAVRNSGHIESQKVMQQFNNVPHRSKAFTTTWCWTLDGLISRAENFYNVPRVSSDCLSLLENIRSHEESGVPLVIENIHRQKDWQPELFHVDKFQELGSSAGGLVSAFHFFLACSSGLLRYQRSQRA